MNTNYNDRFDGLRRLFGDAAYAHLRELHIAVVGIGGVGSWAAEALARSGIGRITLVDWDEIAASNSNRQIHALSSHYGQKKVAVTKQRILDINPECEVNAIDDFLTMDTYEAYLSKGYDCVIDAIDSIKFKAQMIYYCKRNKIPIICTGGAGGRTDPTKIQIKDLSRTCNDALAAKVRARLRDEFNFSKNTKRYFGVKCVFSDEKPLYPKEDGTVGQEKPGIHGVHLDCRFGYGASVTVTATFGFVAASWAIEKCLKARLEPKQSS